tara:strand:- start:271 stop:1506 length:1236 start_codon:yes stop_codon:yes gene_type:complete
MANTKIPVELSSTPGIVDNSDATAITIDSSENVGIGTSSPATHLHLESAGATQLRIRTTSSSSEPQMLMIDGAGDYFAMQKVDKGMTFKPQGGEAMRINDSGNIGIGTTTINSATLGPNNTFVEVAAGTASGSGTLVLSRDSSTNDVELGGIRFVNANNADDDGLDADGKMVAAISARSITSDSNAGDDSGADLTFSTKPEAGSFVERFRIFSLSRPSYSFGTTSTSTTQGPAMYAASTSPSNNTHLWFHFLEAKNNASAAGIKVGGLLASSSYAIADPIRGAIYAQGDVSAQTFTDRTPYPTSLQLAKDVINSHQRRSEEEITRVATEQYNKIQEKSDMPQPEREALSLEEFLDKHKKEYELDHSVLHDYVSDTKYAENGIEGRDASATISCLVEVVKDLMQRIETLEGS